MIRPVAKILVATAGTPVQATSQEPDPTKPVVIHGILVQALPTNQGHVYIGTATMDKDTLADVFAILATPTANFLPTFSAALTIAPNGLSLNQFWIDADNNDDGALVTILVT